MTRRFHPWTAWECVGMYTAPCPEEMTPEGAKVAYAGFLSDTEGFRAAMRGVMRDWPVSCDHFLTNDRSNRLAWLGQASAYYALGLPECYRAGFVLLSLEAQRTANATAAQALREWHAVHGTETGGGDIPCPERVECRAGLTTAGRLDAYVAAWQGKGYPDDELPDEVPGRIASLCLAPSWRAVGVALLRNDVALSSLGVSSPAPAWYGTWQYR